MVTRLDPDCPPTGRSAPGHERERRSISGQLQQPLEGR